MNTINCRIKVNDHQDLPGRSVTPAEVVVLYFLHHKNAGGHPIKHPTEAGRALMIVPGDGKPVVRDRSDIEELNRLKLYYKARQSPDKPNSSFIDDLFPGVATGGSKLPASFKDLPEPYRLKEPIGAPEEPFVRTQDFVKPEPITEEEAAKLVKPEDSAQDADPNKDPGAGNSEGKTGVTDGDITKLTKVQLLDLAEDYQITVSASATKDEIVKAILDGQKAKQPAA